MTSSYDNDNDHELLSMLDKLNDPNYCFHDEDDIKDDIDIDIIDIDNDYNDNNDDDDDPEIDKQLALEFKKLELETSGSIVTVHMTSDEYKQHAKIAMQSGNKDEALRLMKLAKEQSQIEQGINNPASLIRSSSSKSNDSNKRSNQKSSTVPPVKSVKPTIASPTQKVVNNTINSTFISSPSSNNDKNVKVSTPVTPSLEMSWSLLISALEEAIDACKTDALDLGKQGRKAEAIPFMMKLKEYQKELDTAKSRVIIPGARPVLWRWKNETIQKTHENVDMGDDQIQLFIDSAVDMGLTLQAYEGCVVTCEYNLSIPKDTPLSGKAEGKVKAGVVSFQFKKVVEATLKRGSQSLLGLFSRRSATFTLSLKKKGFFSSTTIPLGIATLPLNVLLTKCECGGKLHLYNEAEGRNRSALPGALEVYLRLRRPLDKPDVVITTRSTLILDDWSSVDAISPTSVQPVSSPVISPPPQTSVQINQHIQETNVGHIEVPEPKRIPKIDFSSLTEEEKDDPFSPLIIKSNKALEKEIEEETSKLATTISGDDRLNSQIRLDSLNMQMGRLINAVQDGSLSVPLYKQILQRQIERDKKLALYFNSIPCHDDNDIAENKDTAIKLLKRSKLIAEELQEIESMKDDDM